MTACSVCAKYVYRHRCVILCRMSCHVPSPSPVFRPMNNDVMRSRYIVRYRSAAPSAGYCCKGQSVTLKHFTEDIAPNWRPIRATPSVAGCAMAFEGKAMPKRDCCIPRVRAGRDRMWGIANERRFLECVLIWTLRSILMTRMSDLFSKFFSPASGCHTGSRCFDYCFSRNFDCGYDPSRHCLTTSYRSLVSPTCCIALYRCFGCWRRSADSDSTPLSQLNL